MPPVIGDYFERVTATTLEWTRWSQPDEWKKRFGKTAKIIPSAENKSFLDTLRESLGDEFDEIETFVLPYPSSRRLDRRVSYVEDFCISGHWIFENCVPANPENCLLTGVQEPVAWVSDRNWAPESFAVDSKSYDRALNIIELYEVLQKKRFIENAPDDILGPPRRIYIKNPNGASVLALIRTATASQVDGFRELFMNYITDTPKTSFGLRESDWWGGGGFVIFFNLPFFSISTRSRQDIRTLFNGKKDLRSRDDLSFLMLGGHEWVFGAENESHFDNQPFLHESVFSLMVTGRSDRYWTAVCFDEDFLNENPRLDPDEEIDEFGGAPDPIIVQAGLRATDITVSPRAYSLAAFAEALNSIVEQHQDIQERFQHSLNRYAPNQTYKPPENISSGAIQEWIRRFPEILGKFIHYNSRIVKKLDDFLFQEVIFSSDEIPQGPLWRGVQDEPRALKSLRTIKRCLGKLRGIDDELKRFAETCEEARRDRKNYHADEQQNITKQIQRFTFVTLVVGVLGLAAQLYGSRPEQGDSSSSPGFLALVVASFVICIGASACLFWAGLSQYATKFCRYLAPLLRYFSKTSRTLRRCLREYVDSLRDLLGWIWVYLGVVRR